jgi:MFS family permease
MSDSPSPAPKLSTSLNVKLSTMMFLQYAIWGAWLPFLWSFLSGSRGMDGDQIGNMFAIGAVGAIIGPLVAGTLADRYVSTEKLLAFSHVVGALLIWQLATIESYWGFLTFAGLYGLIYMPTLPLTNSLSFHHIKDIDRDFGRVRVWGTVGWIAVGLAMGHWLLSRHTPTDGVLESAQATLAAALAEGRAAAAVAAQAAVDAAQKLVEAKQAAGKADAFRLSALLGVVMGVYCLFLPHTPPARDAESNPALKSLSAVKAQPLLTLFLLAVPVSCIHQFYFVHTETFLGKQQIAAPEWSKAIFGAGGGGLMTVGQMTEVLVLAAIPFVAKSTSRKALLATGLVAYAARMALFAYFDSIPLPTMATLLIGIGLHGLCFGCFIFVAFMVVDEETSADVRASAQNLFNLVIVGVGVIVGSKIAGWVADWAATIPTGQFDEHGEEQLDIVYRDLFAVPMYAAIACLLLLLAFYRGGRHESSTA